LQGLAFDQHQLSGQDKCRNYSFRCANNADCIGATPPAHDGNAGLMQRRVESLAFALLDLTCSDADQAQIALAARTMSASFFRSSSSVSGLPATVEANPHCGL